MKITSKTYKTSEKSKRAVLITVDEDFGGYVSVHDFGAPCSGILKHWGTPKELITELEEIIVALKEIEALVKKM